MSDDTKGPISYRKEMVLMATNCFKTLYKCEDVWKAFTVEGNDISDEETAPIILLEVTHVIKGLRKNKAPRWDHECSPNSRRSDCNPTDAFVQQDHHEKRHPRSMKNRKGNRSELDNYRPISLCSVIAKVFTSLLKQRVSGKWL